MSHVATCKAKLLLRNHIATAAAAMGWEITDATSAVFYDRTTHEGIVIAAEGWRYPIVVKEDGSIAYDDYGGDWGDVEDLSKFQSEYTYAVMVETMEARTDGAWHVEHHGYDENNRVQGYAWCEEG